MKRKHRFGARINPRIFAATLLAIFAGPGFAQHLAGLGVRNITPCTAVLSASGACRPDFVDVRTENLTTSGGNGARVTAVHSELTTRALAIQDSTGRRVVIVTLDLLFADQSLTAEIRTALGQLYPALSSNDVIVNASHTHNAPAVVDLSNGMISANGVATEPPPSLGYRAAVKARVIAAVQDAVAALQPVQLEFRRGVSRICAYRRSDGRSPNTYPAPKTLDSLLIRAADGGTLGIVATTGCHSVTMVSRSGVVSADFAGVLRSQLESSFPAQQARPVAMFLQGFAGDVNPVTNFNGYSAEASVAETGSTLAQEVLNLNRLPGTALTGNLATSMLVRHLPLSPATTSWANDGSASMAIGVQTLQIGADPSSAASWTLVAFGGEVVSEYEGFIRSNFAGAKHLTLLGYSNDTPGYVPTQRMIGTDATRCGLLPGGYEGCFSFCLRYLPVAKWTDDQFYTNRDGLIDRFGDASRAGDTWVKGALSTVNGADITSPSVAVSEVGGRLRIVPAAGASGLRYSGYVSTNTHGFSGRQFGVRVIQIPNAQTNAEALISVGSSGRDLYRFNIQSGLLRADALVNGTPYYTALGAYSLASHRYLRLRHDAGTDRMLWEASADGAAWTALHSRLRDASFKLATVRAELIAGTFAPVASPGTAVFDDAALGAAYPMPRTESFFETFEDVASASRVWEEAVLSAYQQQSLADSFIDVFRGAGGVEISPIDAEPGHRYNGLSTKDSFAFAGRRTIFEIAEIPRVSGDAEMLASVFANGNNGYRFRIHQGMLRADVIVNGSQTYIPLSAFDSASHRYLSIRHDSATDRIDWQASTDGAHWVTLHSVARASSIDLASVQFEMIAGTYVAVSQPGRAAFGSFEYR